MKWLIAGIVTIAAAAALARRNSDAAWSMPDYSAWLNPDIEPDQNTSFIEDTIVNLDPTNNLPANVPQAVAATNVRAFLDMIAFAEGTAGPDGYRTMFGYRLFDDFSDHPRQYFEFTAGGKTQKTSAAGRYQFLARTWDGLRAKLGLPDFGPESQDAGAVELIRQRGALADVQAGRLTAAIAKVAPIWASLPGAGYSQPERKLPQLLAAYNAAGGVFEG